MKCVPLSSNIWVMPICGLVTPPFNTGFQYNQFNSSMCSDTPFQSVGGFVELCVPDPMNKNQSMMYSCDAKKITISKYSGMDCKSNATETMMISDQCQMMDTSYVNFVACQKVQVKSSPSKSSTPRVSFPNTNDSRLNYLSLIVIALVSFILFLQ
jgi:hypothetical protein